MDPATIASGAYGFARVFSACARGTQDADKAIGYARRKYRLLGTYSVSWLSYDFTPSDGTVGFTAHQLGDIGRFLNDEAVKPILALLAVANLTIDVDSVLVAHLQDAFTSEAAKWNASNSGSWQDHAGDVWNRLIELHHEMLPPGDAAEGLRDDIEYFEDFVNTPLQMSAGTGKFRARLASHLIDLSSDFNRLHKAFVSSEQTAMAIGATRLDPILTHTELGMGTTPTFDALYVDRSFVDERGDATTDSTLLVIGDTPFRVILTGAPGAGKTTFVQHFRTRMCQTQQKPVFAVRCREYAATNWDRIGLIDFALDRHNAEYSDDLEHSTIRDMLILGRGVLILDGLDEVTDPLRRVDLVRRINALAAQYPLASMLVTSREVGYDRAPVDPAIFTRVRLKEFTLEQTLAYAQKWFGLVDRTDLIDRFMHDSETIPDLRLNPLMLSLLCLLYRESGSIPSRRLDVYSECARLLFHRWDRHRQIQVDGAVPDFSDNLMQEIARWFYTSSTAQAGLDETVIKGMLRRILIDQHGFRDSKATDASSDFLEFCAGRAWLLGKIGSNSRGERLFAFTHKTFYEYFAAESFARNATNVSEVCARIQSVFANDASSVLPELLIQSYGKHSSQGAVRIMRELGEGAAPLLLLRLMEGATLPASSREIVFERLADRWKKGHFSAVELLAILQLNPLARDQFVNDYLEKYSELRAIFLSGWASVTLAGLGNRFESVWRDSVAQLTSISDIEEWASVDSAIWHWLASKTDLEIPKNPTSLLVAEGVFGAVPGVAWYAVEQKLRKGKTIPAESVLNSYVGAVVEFLGASNRIPNAIMREFSNSLRFGDSSLAWSLKRPSVVGDDIYFQLFAYIAFALAEFRRENYVASTGTFSSGPLREVIEVWRLKRDGTEPDADQIQAALVIAQQLPDRLRRWTLGKGRLVARPR